LRGISSHDFKVVLLKQFDLFGPQNYTYFGRFLLEDREHWLSITVKTEISDLYFFF
jgi:hypothetical protein